MGQRPSQCGVCWSFSFCLAPGAVGCAEAAENKPETKEKNMTKRDQQQYSTPDGSIWEVSYADSDCFLRVGSPDGSHENDFRPQKLVEVLKTWGPLSLHDPNAAELLRIKAVLWDVSYNSDPETFAKRIQAAMRNLDLRLVKESELEG